MDTTIRKNIAVGSLLMALAVGLGAFGAHGLKGQLSDHYFGVFETANKYHFIHVLGWMIVLLIFDRYQVDIRKVRITNALFFLGFLCFSVALYLLSLKELIGGAQFGILGAVAPIGGLSWIIAWMYAAWQLIRTNA